MRKIYVLVNTRLDKENSFENDVRKLSQVTDVVHLHGAWNVLVTLQGTIDELRETIVWKIRRNEHVTETMTLVETEK